MTTGEIGRPGPKTIRNEVLSRLRDAIVNGEIGPHQRLIENDLALKYGVSRTPVREAVRELERIGLVRSEPYKGAFVADFDSQATANLYAIRAALEGLAGQLATRNLAPEEVLQLKKLQSRMKKYPSSIGLVEFSSLNERFHKVLYRASSNPQLLEIIDNLLEQVRNVRISAWYEPEAIRRSLVEHDAIIAAIQVNDSRWVREILERHVSLIVKDDGSEPRS